jgi:Flp pilus assembly protein TadD
MDAAHYDAAEKWYRAAALKKPNDVMVVDGLAFVLLQKGDAKGAEEQINKLAKIEPTNQDLPQFRDKLAELKAKPK